MDQRISPFWEKKRNKSVWDKVGLPKRRPVRGLVGKRLEGGSIFDFRLFVAVAVVVVILIAAILALDRDSGRNHQRVQSQASVQAPADPRFSDGCGNPYYPLYADGEVIFAEVKGNRLGDIFRLTTIERDGDEYAQRIEAKGKKYPIALTCRDSKVEVRAYVDWAGTFGEPLRAISAGQVSGVRVPTSFNAGDRWRSEYSVSAAELPPDRVFGADSMVISAESDSYAPEILTTPAGQFKVIRVQVRERIRYLAGDGTEVHEPVEQVHYEYWSMGKGLVRIHAEKVNDWDYVMVGSGERKR